MKLKKSSSVSKSTNTLDKSGLVDLQNNRTFQYGNNSVSFRGKMLLNCLPDAIKDANRTKVTKIIESWTDFLSYSLQIPRHMTI